MYDLWGSKGPSSANFSGSSISGSDACFASGCWDHSRTCVWSVDISDARLGSFYWDQTLGSDVVSAAFLLCVGASCWETRYQPTKHRSVQQSLVAMHASRLAAGTTAAPGSISERERERASERRRERVIDREREEGGRKRVKTT